MKNRARIDEIELRDTFRRHLNRRQLGAQLFGQTKQDLRYLARLALVQVLQLVVRIDSLERLDKSGRA